MGRDPGGNLDRELGLECVHIETFGDIGADAPRLPRPPSSIAEIVGDRSEGIGAVGEDVGPPVPIAIGSEAEIDRGEELWIAECTRIAPNKLIA